MSEKTSNTIRLCLAHTSEAGEEMIFIKLAFDTNWMVTLGPNVNGFEKDLEEFITAKRGTIQGRFVPSQWFHGHR